MDLEGIQTSLSKGAKLQAPLKASAAVGRVAVGADLAFRSYDIAQADNKLTRTAANGLDFAGGLVAAKAGAEFFGALGGLAGPLGAAVGAATGAIGGAFVYGVASSANGFVDVIERHLISDSFRQPYNIRVGLAEQPSPGGPFGAISVSYHDIVEAGGVWEAKQAAALGELAAKGWQTVRERAEAADQIASRSLEARDERPSYAKPGWGLDTPSERLAGSRPAPASPSSGSGVSGGGAKPLAHPGQTAAATAAAQAKAQSSSSSLSGGTASKGTVTVASASPSKTSGGLSPTERDERNQSKASAASSSTKPSASNTSVSTKDPKSTNASKASATSNLFLDIGGDGYKYRTAWVGAGDGVADRVLADVTVMNANGSRIQTARRLQSLSSTHDVHRKLARSYRHGIASAHPPKPSPAGTPAWRQIARSCAA